MTRTRMAVASGGALAALAALGLVASREEVAFYLKLLRANHIAQAFYRDYEHLTRDVPFHPEMAPRLDVYSPAEGDRRPVLIFVHGGSWRSYNKKLFAPVAMKLLPQGVVVVIPDYTLFPDARYDQMTRQVAAAVSWTLEHIEGYGGDPARIALAGHSAGAHLSALAVLDQRYLAELGHSSAELCSLVGASGVYDIEALYAFQRSKDQSGDLLLEIMNGRENFATASPASHVRADLPPVTLIHGRNDETVPASMSEAFHAALQRAGASSRLILYPDADHTDFLFKALTEEHPRIVADLLWAAYNCLPTGR